MAQALGSISDLPEDILAGILLSVCVNPEGPGGAERVSMRQVRVLCSVCTTWRDVLRSSWERASCSLTRNANVALQELRSLRNVTHVSILEASESTRPGWLWRGLTAGFPLLTSFHLAVGGTYQALEDLSLFLSLGTNIQELSLAFDNSRHLKFMRAVGVFDSYSRYYHRYLESLEAMDFASLAHLKKLTLDFRKISLPSQYLNGRCFPVSRTLAQVASLEEIHISVKNLSSPLPPWLAALPALAGVRLTGNPGASVLDPEASMTQLRELSIRSFAMGAREMDAVSRMTRLTALQLVSLGGQESPLPLLRLSPTLRRLELGCAIVPQNAVPLPNLEDLTLRVTAAVQPDYFAFTPGLRKLDLSLERDVVWPRLEHHLTQLTFLALDLSSEVDPGEPPLHVWRIDEAHTRSLRVLVLRTCRLLPAVGGLLNLERHVVVSLRCTCEKDGLYYDSHAEYEAAQQRRTCGRLPPGDAWQLFKDTRYTSRRPPAVPAPAARAVSRAVLPMDRHMDSDLAVRVRQVSERRDFPARLVWAANDERAAPWRSSWSMRRPSRGGFLTAARLLLQWKGPKKPETLCTFTLR
eukprot:jgi/Mesen1/5522/ME000279S04728